MDLVYIWKQETPAMRTDNICSHSGRLLLGRLF